MPTIAATPTNAIGNAGLQVGIALGACAGGGGPLTKISETERIFIEAATTWDLDRDGVVTCDEWKRYAGVLARDADANGDGVGDFQGVTAKLDYVRDLGVNTIWLMPFYPSPLRDDGYDISHYEDVHPQYGTLDDFRAMLDAAHQRGLRVIRLA